MNLRYLLGKSKSGQRVYRYQEGKDFQIADITDPKARDMLEEFIEKNIGEIDAVYHELISHLVHLDVYVVKATEERPYHTLITGGMSDLPMNVPKEAKKYGYSEYAELMTFLPKEWPLDEEYMKQNEELYFWPIQNLKTIARVPHEYDTFVGQGHTIQNSNPIEPFAPNTELCASLLLPPLLLPQECWELKIRWRKTISFFNVQPIYLEEMQVKLDYGVEELYDRFDEIGVSPVVDVTRKNTCK